MAPRSYEDVLARNVAALRSRARLNQDLVAARMQALGYTAWLRQTVANVEKGKRRLTGGEVHALAWVLQTTIDSLVKPTPDDLVVDFPSGATISVASVRRSVDGLNDGAVGWDGAEPVFDPEPVLTQLAGEGTISRSRVSRGGEVTRQDPESGEWEKS